MEQNSAVKMVNSLYEQENYMGAAQASLELLKDPALAREGHLLFAKAFIQLLPNVNDEEKWESVYSSAAEVAARSETIQEVFQAEGELKEAFEQWHRSKFVTIVGNLENNPTLENWKIFIKLPVEYIMAGIKITTMMFAQPNVKRMLEAEGGGKAARDKYGLTPSKSFTNEELKTMVFDAANRIAANLRNFVASEMDASTEYVQAQLRPVFDRLYTLQCMYDYAIGEVGNADDDLIIARAEKKIKFIDSFLNAYIYPNGQQMYLLRDSTRAEWQDEKTKTKSVITAAKKNIQKRKQEEMKKRVEAYWLAHPEEKARLEEERKQLAARIKELDVPIRTAREEAEKLRSQKKQPLPEEKECDQQRHLIKTLEEERAGCGLFKGKQKKALTARLNEVEKPRLVELEQVARNKRKTYEWEIEQKISEILKTVEPQEQEKNCLTVRDKELQTELTKDR